MADRSSLIQNMKVKKEENVVERFPYKILNDLAKKLKAAEDKIASMLSESDETQLGNVCNQADQVAVPDETSKDVKDHIICSLKQRYHLAISYCTVCASDAAAIFDVSSKSSELSISGPYPVVMDDAIVLEPKVSPPVQCSGVPSSVPALSKTPPPLLFSPVNKVKSVDSVVKRKDRNFITRMTKTLVKLEAKYQTPEHKRKRRLFTRRQRTSSIVPKEFSSIFHVLGAPQPAEVTVPDPYPHVRWTDVKFKPALPNPEQCPIHSCSPDPEFYLDRNDPSFHCNYNFDYLASQNGRPFGALPGYKTSLGIVAVPSTPVGGYVYCQEVKKWVIHAAPRSSASAGRGTLRGGAMSLTRRRRSKE